MTTLRKSLTALAAATLPLFASAAPENFPLDPTHTYPSFWVEHWGLSMLHGRFDKSSGRFTIDRATKTGSTEITIDTASITTGDAVKGNRPQSRDDHLKNADFFNVREFPTMTFKSTRVVWTGELPSAVEGNLTLLGVTKPLTLSFERFKCGQNPFTKKDRCGGNAVGKFKRSDFGMKYAIPAVGDEITLNIEFEGDKE
ncbi:MAG: polyisoprenoid-binding protein [Rubrivivax sp.]|nr:polyisoprenoid-binding protein [Rubrivivax sp.]